MNRYLAMNLTHRKFRLDNIKKLIILAVLTIVGFSIQSCVMLLEMRRDTWRHETQGSRNLLVAEADNIGRTVEFYDRSLESTASLLFEPGMATADVRLQQLALFDRSMSGTYFGAVRVIDTNGTVTHDSLSLSPMPPSPTELAALLRHRENLTSTLFITSPFGCQANDPGTINLSRRIEAPDGRFAGIVTGSIRLAYFKQLFGSLNLGPHDVVSLFRSDGTLLAHAPGISCILKSISGSEVMHRLDKAKRGTFVARSVLDNQFRVYTFAHLGNSRLILDVGLSLQDIYAPWREKARLAGLCLLTIILVSTGLLLLLRRELQTRNAAEHKAQENEARYRLLADYSSDLILRFDNKLVRTYVSPSCRAYGYEPNELIGDTAESWMHPDDWPVTWTLIQNAQNCSHMTVVTYRVRHKDGHYIWVEGYYNFIPSDAGFIAVIRDINKRKLVEAELEQVNGELRRLATVDALSGLANRRSFDEQFLKEWSRANRGRTNVAILMIDIDHFKNYNDNYGHQGGDKVISAVGKCIQSNVRRPGDLTARYGGEEFVVILSDADLFGAIQVAETIRHKILALAIPHVASSYGVVSISIGVSSALPCLGIGSTETLFAAADLALYDAKRAGRNGVRSRSMAAGPDGAMLDGKQIRSADRD